jgi:adenylosuccinate synthase
MTITKVDICCGLSWGDEGKGKLVSYLARHKNYDFVCRWAGGNNAGHTIYINGNRYKTNLIPSGVFYGVRSVIGPGCVVNYKAFTDEITYLQENGFDTSLVKISPKTHVIMDKHVEEDIEKYREQGSTCKGIAPCYRDKYGRTGVRVENVPSFSSYLWDEQLYGNILCEGAQGFWLDIDYGNYPYTTSSNTLPYSACSLGFSPKVINNIYGAVKIYDTRVGNDPDFPDNLLEDEELSNVAKVGNEYGTTTGRARKVNWLDLEKLIKAINISGTTHIIISKVDILEKIGIYKIIYNDNTIEFSTMEDMKNYITGELTNKCSEIKKLIYSGNIETIDGL